MSPRSEERSLPDAFGWWGEGELQWACLASRIYKELQTPRPRSLSSRGDFLEALSDRSVQRDLLIQDSVDNLSPPALQSMTKSDQAPVPVSQRIVSLRFV